MDMQQNGPRFWRSPGGIGLLVVALVGGFFLLTEHWAHLLGWLPFLLILACPLMHIFMHHGHGLGGETQGATPREATMNSANSDYGLWSLVLLNSGIFIGFAYSFFKPSTLRDWRSFGA